MVNKALTAGGVSSDTERVIYSGATGSYIASVISVDDFKKFKYIKTMSSAEFQTYVGCSTYSPNHSSVNMYLHNSSGTALNTIVLTGADTDISALDLTNVVCVGFGTGATSGAVMWALLLHN